MNFILLVTPEQPLARWLLLALEHAKPIDAHRTDAWGKDYSGRTNQHSTWSLRDEPGGTEEEERVAFLQRTLCRRAWERLRGLGVAGAEDEK